MSEAYYAYTFYEPLRLWCIEKLATGECQFMALGCTEHEVRAIVDELNAKVGEALSKKAGASCL